ncbi:S9 family peptidase [Lacticaseibacillus pabuli]|uniref:S9 family peptidase n=1 Tax=Lacticaseibacillus pabuli TaxID=3025672 RepID=A0ABY7WSC0_9LACO|nr:S9 family peptidase [Lacticaseibacillus sp. KACC 23028]WDF81924.1 S9 family peptidase [Lacticaseibacillus sp. KACC 23028]
MQQVQAKDLYTIKVLGQPQATSDRVFYEETRIDEATQQYLTAIYAIMTNSHKRVRYGTNGQHDEQPRVNQNGSWLAFLALDAADTKQVFLQAITGGAARQFTTSSFGVTDFAWTADGTAILYTETRHPERPKKLHPARYTRSEYRFNGQGYFAEDETFYLMAQDLGAAKPTEYLQRDFDFKLQAVSPDGHWVALSTAADPLDINNPATNNFLFDLTNQQSIQIHTHCPRGAFTAESFSPDGQQLLFSGEPDDVPTDLRSCLFSYTVADGKFALAQQDDDQEIGSAIAADMQQNLSGRAAIFATDGQAYALVCKHGAVELCRGTELTPVLAEKIEITDFDVANDGKTAFVTYSTPVSPSRLMVLNLTTGAHDDLYNPNADYEQSHSIVDPQAFSFERDGYRLQGWYYAPAESLDIHPAVLYVHGGPHAAYGYSFFHELQVMASQGYGVITLNPRGSSSYGNAFKTAVIQHYGEGDYDDLLAAVDYAQTLDQTIDAQRVYLTGGSYGGFISNWAETHTNRFKAIATSRSIANWTSMLGTSDIGSSFTPRELSAQFEADLNDQATLWRFSPLAYVAHANTPILILHGEEDYRCPIEQGEQFYMALKQRGVETEMLRFPKSNHELSRSGLPALRIDRMQAITDWFERHE